MMQHSWDTLADLIGADGPSRTGPKCEGLWCIFAERRREQLKRLDVRVIHDLDLPISQISQKERKPIEGTTDIVLLASEIAQLQTPAQTSFPILLCRGEKQAEPVVHESSAVAPRRSKVDQFDLPHA
jgi:hypothetical protein